MSDTSVQYTIRMLTSYRVEPDKTSSTSNGKAAGTRLRHRSRLLELPAEPRDEICELVIFDSLPSPADFNDFPGIHWTAHPEAMRQRYRQPQPMLATCRLVREEFESALERCFRVEAKVLESASDAALPAFPGGSRGDLGDGTMLSTTSRWLALMAVESEVRGTAFDILMRRLDRVWRRIPRCGWETVFVVGMKGKGASCVHMIGARIRSYESSVSKHG